MPRFVVGLVTLFHADEFAEKADLRFPSRGRPDVPYRVRPRKHVDQQLARLESEGKVRRKPYYRNGKTSHPAGIEIRQFRGKVVKGSLIAPFLAEPRIVHIPDAPAPDATWKAEFRKHWPDREGELPREYVEEFRRAIATSDLQINGLWTNPTVSERFETKDWVNLVLGPFEGFSGGQNAHLRFFREGENFCVQWD